MEQINGITISDIVQETIRDLQQQSFIPYKTGNLKYNAIKPIVTNAETGILFSGQIAPYIDFLEYGTGPHIIKDGFGRGITIHHPGSTKHKGFISEKSVQRVLYTLASKFNGKVEY